MAGRAEAAAAAGAVEEALGIWRRALDLLPPGSRQREQVSAKIEELGRASPGAAGTAARPNGASRAARGRVLAGLGVAGLFLWKFKVIVLFVATKAKLLLLGFTKIGTVLSGLAAFGVYWSLWGWKFALGFVLSIYVHEMGHVAALRRYGIPATAPMFIPGLGAFVRLKQNPANLREDARVALAGPLWGLGAALVAWAIGALGGGAFWLALARTGALINLFNLLPIGPLDGGRAFRALGRQQRWGICMVIAAAMVVSGEPLLIVLLLVAGVRALASDLPREPDRGAFFLFAVVLAALALLARVPAAVTG
jgi:Zn-dependent protease